MKALIAAVVGLFGLVAYVHRRRRPSVPEVEPADELRAKLAQQKDEPPPAAEPETAAEAEPQSALDTVGERREDVHDRARAAIDDLG